jgi:hypothetical protein
LMLLSLTAITVAALSACSLGQSTEPTSTATADINAVQTSAAATARVELTQIAAAAPPTSTATVPATVAPDTETPTQGPTNTEGPSSTPAPTDTLEPGATALPSETPVVSGTTAVPSLTPIASGGGGSSGPTCLASKLEGETIPDGTVMKPGEEFVKIWKIRNIGICSWLDGFYFAGWIGPSSMTANPYYFRTSNNFVDPNEAISIPIDMVAPDKPGDYIAHWAIYNPDGVQFGDFTVEIKVVK